MARVIYELAIALVMWVLIRGLAAFAAGVFIGGLIIWWTK